MARRPPTPEQIAAALRSLATGRLAAAIARTERMARRDPRALDALVTVLDRLVREHPELPALRGFRAVVLRLRGPRNGDPARGDPKR